MLDQAHDLRRLATQCRPTAARPPAGQVAGGRRRQRGRGHDHHRHPPGHRPWPKPADARCWSMPIPAAATSHCAAAIEERHTLADLLAGRHNWAEVIEAAPGGIQLVAGARWSDDLGHRSPAAAERLIELLGDQPRRRRGGDRRRKQPRPSRAAHLSGGRRDRDGHHERHGGGRRHVRRDQSTGSPARNQDGTDMAEPAFPLHLLVNMARTAGTPSGPLPARPGVPPAAGHRDHRPMAIARRTVIGTQSCEAMIAPVARTAGS